MSSNIEPTGYDQEEATFKEKEREAIAALRAKLDAQRASAAESQAKSAHWMRCPKCGGQMTEKRHENVNVDVCGSCGGIYFDAGELDLLLKHEKEASTLLGRLFGH
jgi:hypothetical protein